MYVNIRRNIRSAQNLWICSMRWTQTHIRIMRTELRLKKQYQKSTTTFTHNTKITCSLRLQYVCIWYGEVGKHYSVFTNGELGCYYAIWVTIPNVCVCVCFCLYKLYGFCCILQNTQDYFNSRNTQDHLRWFCKFRFISGQMYSNSGLQTHTHAPKKKHCKLTRARNDGTTTHCEIGYFVHDW